MIPKVAEVTTRDNSTAPRASVAAAPPCPLRAGRPEKNFDIEWDIHGIFMENPL